MMLTFSEGWRKIGLDMRTCQLMLKYDLLVFTAQG